MTTRLLKGSLVLLWWRREEREKARMPSLDRVKGRLWKRKEQQESIGKTGKASRFEGEGCASKASRIELRGKIYLRDHLL